MNTLVHLPFFMLSASPTYSISHADSATSCYLAHNLAHADMHLFSCKRFHDFLLDQTANSVLVTVCIKTPLLLNCAPDTLVQDTRKHCIQSIISMPCTTNTLVICSSSSLSLYLSCLSSASTCFSAATWTYTSTSESCGQTPASSPVPMESEGATVSRTSIMLAQCSYASFHHGSIFTACPCAGVSSMSFCSQSGSHDFTGLWADFQGVTICCPEVNDAFFSSLSRLTVVVSAAQKIAARVC